MICFIALSDIGVSMEANVSSILTQTANQINKYNYDLA